MNSKCYEINTSRVINPIRFCHKVKVGKFQKK